MLGKSVLILSFLRLAHAITNPSTLSNRHRMPQAPIYIPAFPWLWLDTMHTAKKPAPEHSPTKVATIARGGCFLSVNFNDDCFCLFFAISYLIFFLFLLDDKRYIPLHRINKR